MRIRISQRGRGRLTRTNRRSIADISRTDPLAFIALMRGIVDDEIKPAEAVKVYHAELKRQKVSSRRSLADDLKSITTEMSYSR